MTSRSHSEQRVNGLFSIFGSIAAIIVFSQKAYFFAVEIFFLHYSVIRLDKFFQWGTRLADRACITRKQPDLRGFGRDLRNQKLDLTFVPTNTAGGILGKEREFSFVR